MEVARKICIVILKVKGATDIIKPVKRHGDNTTNAIENNIGVQKSWSLSHGRSQFEHFYLGIAIHIVAYMKYQLARHPASHGNMWWPKR